jgi:hypothetical protein
VSRFSAPLVWHVLAGLLLDALSGSQCVLHDLGRLRTCAAVAPGAAAAYLLVRFSLSHTHFKRHSWLADRSKMCCDSMSVPVTGGPCADNAAQRRWIGRLADGRLGRTHPVFPLSWGCRRRGIHAGEPTWKAYFCGITSSSAPVAQITDKCFRIRPSATADARECCSGVQSPITGGSLQSNFSFF